MWEIRFVGAAVDDLREIKDRRVRQKLKKRLRRLKDDPYHFGKPLTDDLRGLHSMRAVGQRYRIVYRISEGKETVFIIGAGIRKAGDKNDIYSRVKRRFTRKLKEFFGLT